MPRGVETGKNYIFADSDPDAGSQPQGITFHVLPPGDPELAYNILKNEVGGTRMSSRRTADDQDAQLLAWYDANAATPTGNPDGDKYLRDKWLADIKARPDLVQQILQDKVSRRQALQDTNVLEKEVMGPAGGFSIKDHIGDGPTQGYMVSLNKATERGYPENSFTADDIAQYQQQHQSELSQSNCYFGAWHDPESHMVYLDCSYNFPDLDSAMKAAKAADQIAIFDLSDFETIYTSRRKERRQFFPAYSDPNAVFNQIWGE